MKLVKAILLSLRLPVLFSVWSNSLAGWWLGGAGETRQLLLLLGATGLSWIGLALLNDVFDSDHDRQHHPGRLIAAGLLPRSYLHSWALTSLSCSILLVLYAASWREGLFCLFVVCLGIVTLAVHRTFLVWPALAGFCRILVYLLAASMAEKGITGLAIWSGFAIGAYAAGIGCYQRWVALPNHTRSWPVLLLMVPAALALVVNAGPFLQAALLLAAVFCFWVAFAIYQGRHTRPSNPTLTVAWLVPGIILADWLALGNPPGQVSVAFLALFIAAVSVELATPRPSPAVVSAAPA